MEYVSYLFDTIRMISNDVLLAFESLSRRILKVMAVSAIKLQKHYDAQKYLTQRFVETDSNFCVSLQKTSIIYAL